MSRVSQQLRALAGCGPDPPVPDAALVAGHLAGDPAALADIVERHGPAVWRVCRAHLRAADADDAFQATVLVFLRDAGRIRDPAALGGWLVRVAHLVSLKARRDAGRRRLAPLPADAPGRATDPAAAAEAGELSAAVVAELARLPERLRAVLVLCALEGLSNTEAAAVLVIPRGTVDSRLATAKARLRTRLVRRGLAPAAALLTPAADATRAAARLADLAPALTRTAAPAALILAHGVTTTMSTLKLLACGVVAAGVVGTAGWGVVRSGAQDGPPGVKEAAKPADADATRIPAPPSGLQEPKPPAAGKPGTDTKGEDRIPVQIPPLALPEAKPPMAARPVPLTEADVRRLLTEKCDLGSLAGLTVDQVFATLIDRGLNVRFDVPAIKRYNDATRDESPLSNQWFFLSGSNPLETKIPNNVSSQNTYADLLADLVACLPGRLTYRIRGGQVLIGPAYIPPRLLVDPKQSPQDQSAGFGYAAEQLLGPPVSVSFADAPLDTVIQTLQTTTGANIVYKYPKNDTKPPAITLAVHDVRLAGVLELISDLVDLRVVYFGNVYYLTDPQSAARLQQKADRELFGEGGTGTVAPAKPIRPQG